MTHRVAISNQRDKRVQLARNLAKFIWLYLLLWKPLIDLLPLKLSSGLLSMLDYVCETLCAP